MNQAEDDLRKCFMNHYACPACATRWSDCWTAQCNDRCPSCGLREIEPFASDDA